MLSKFARVLPLILCLWLPGAVLAQTQEPEVEEQQPAADAEVTADEQASPAPEAETGQQPSPHDYRPSEDISEDLSVSFPVDI